MTIHIQQIPLSKLVLSKSNVRTTGRAEGVEELASSIAALGLLQNLTVMPTGKRFEVIAGGRRLAALKLLTKRKEWERDAPVPCQVVEGWNVTEISLAENAMQRPMHPADQFEAFAELQRQRRGVEEIAAHFGVTPHVVTQRLKLGAVSPKLMEAYREGELNLDQLSAFAITDDHAAQERVWEGLGDNRSRAAILRALSEGQVRSDDSRALYLGAEAYIAAGGTIIRDLFDDEGGGFFGDAALLNRLVTERLAVEAKGVSVEGWKWVSVEAEFSYGLLGDMRRVYPQRRIFTEAEETRLEELSSRCETLREEADDELDVATEQEMAKLEAEMDAIHGADIYANEDRVFAGALVTLDDYGQLRIERGLVRREDDPRRGASVKREQDSEKANGDLPEKLVAALTAHRTAALANELAQRPNLALVAVVHALAAGAFFGPSARVSCLEIAGKRTELRRFADDIGDTRAVAESEARHAQWEQRMPEDAEGLWEFVAALSDGERLVLLAHCASLTVDAVLSPKPFGFRAVESAADILATALGLEMTAYWQPTAAYFGRLAKPAIVMTVREAVSPEAAQTLDGLKKPDMARRAEALLAGNGWLPEVLR